MAIIRSNPLTGPICDACNSMVFVAVIGDDGTSTVECSECGAFYLASPTAPDRSAVMITDSDVQD